MEKNKQNRTSLNRALALCHNWPVLDITFFRKPSVLEYLCDFNSFEFNATLNDTVFKLSSDLCPVLWCLTMPLEDNSEDTPRPGLCKPPLQELVLSLMEHPLKIM